MWEEPEGVGEEATHLEDRWNTTGDPAVQKWILWEIGALVSLGLAFVDEEASEPSWNFCRIWMLLIVSCAEVVFWPLYPLSWWQNNCSNMTGH